jgi:hypothetical protein
MKEEFLHIARPALGGEAREPEKLKHREGDGAQGCVGVAGRPGAPHVLDDADEHPQMIRKPNDVRMQIAHHQVRRGAHTQRQLTRRLGQLARQTNVLEPGRD